MRIARQSQPRRASASLGGILIVTSRSHPASGRGRARRRLTFEPLEERTLLSGWGPTDYLVSDTGAGRIAVFDEYWMFLDYLDPDFPGASGMDFMPGGDLVVVSQSTREVRRYDSDGNLVAGFTDPAVGSPGDLKTAPDGQIYVATADTAFGISEFDADGNLLRSLGAGASYTGAAVVPDDELWVGAVDLFGAVSVFDLQTGSPKRTIILDVGQLSAETMRLGSNGDTVLMTDPFNGAVFERDTSGSFVRQYPSGLTGISLLGTTPGPMGDVLATAFFATPFVLKWDADGNLVGSTDISANVQFPGNILWAGVAMPAENEPPIAVASLTGAAYTVDEGATVLLDGSDSFDPDGTIVSYAWDLDFDSMSFDVDATGATPTFNASALDGPSSRNVALRVTDDGGLTDEDSAVVNVVNVAPEAALSGPTEAPAGLSVTFTLEAFDPSAADRAAGFTFDIDFGDGTAPQRLTGPSGTTVSHTFTTADMYVVVLTAIDKDGGLSEAVTHTITIGAANQPPVADAGGPYTVDEGSAVDLDASASSDPDGTIVSYEWDLDFDGMSFDVNATGQVVSFDASFLDGPAVRTVALRVTDDGGLTEQTSTTVEVANVAPTARVFASSVGLVGQAESFILNTTDPSEEDQRAGFAFTINFGDGSGPMGVMGPSGTSISHTYSAPGNYVVTLTATDKDGGQSQQATHSITITPVPALDFGDAPEPYPTLRDDFGARHVATGPTLGVKRDAEPDGQPHPQARGDDEEQPPLAIDDEDGLVRAGLFRGCASFLTVNVQGVSGTHFLNAFVDLNGNGSWTDDDEAVVDHLPVTSNGDHTFVFPVPPGSGRVSFARIRLSSGGNINEFGLARDGEVEDHRVIISSFGPRQVFVDDDWSGTELGADPDGAGPAEFFGVDSFAVIQQAIRCVAPGGTVRVFEGDYAEELTIPKALTLQGDGPAMTRIDASGGAVGISVLADNVNLQSFAVTGSGFVNIQLGELRSGTVSGLTVSDVHSTGTTFGMQGRLAGNSRIEKSRFAQNKFGMSLDFTGATLELIDLTVEQNGDDSGGYGALVVGGKSIKITGGSFRHNRGNTDATTGGHGLIVSLAGAVRVRDMAATDNGGHGLRLRENGTVTISGTYVNNAGCGIALQQNKSVKILRTKTVTSPNAGGTVCTIGPSGADASMSGNSSAAGTNSADSFAARIPDASSVLVDQPLDAGSAHRTAMADELFAGLVDTSAAAVVHAIRHPHGPLHTDAGPFPESSDEDPTFDRALTELLIGSLEKPLVADLLSDG